MFNRQQHATKPSFKQAKLESTFFLFSEDFCGPKVNGFLFYHPLFLFPLMSLASSIGRAASLSDSPSDSQFSAFFFSLSPTCLSLLKLIRYAHKLPKLLLLGLPVSRLHGTQIFYSILQQVLLRRCRCICQKSGHFAIVLTSSALTLTPKLGLILG